MGNPTKYALALAGFCVMVGCQGAKKTEKVAPWQASPATKTEEGELPLTLIPSGSSKLTFSLPAKGATPRGSITGPTGSLKTDLMDLAQTTGDLEFRLGSLRMDSDGLGADEARTQVARNWFGPVGSEEYRAEMERIALHIYSLDQVRPLRPLQGETLPDPSGSGLIVKRVRATAKGHLVLRRLGVDAELPLTLDFFYRTTEGQSPHPERVVAVLTKPLKVLLQEHEIAPRDDSGALDLKGNELLGSLVGHAALVEGSLEFFPQAPPTPAPSVSSAKP